MTLINLGDAVGFLPLPKPGAGAQQAYHLVYNDEDGSFWKLAGEAPAETYVGGYSELSPGHFWGAFRRPDGRKALFHNNKIYKDAPSRFLVHVEMLGPREARLLYIQDGKVVEQTVYRRVTGVGVSWADAFEEDLDIFLAAAMRHAPRRALWPELFPDG